MTDDQRASGVALINISVRVGVIVGPALGVALLASGGPRLALGVTAALFSLAALMIRLVNEPAWFPVRGRSMLADVAAGISDARHRPWLLTLLLFSPVSIVFVIAPTQVLLPIVSRDTFGSDAVFGTALACFGVGGLGGSQTAMAWRPRSPGTVAMCSMTLSALIPLTLLSTPSRWVLFGGYLVAGFGIQTYALCWDIACNGRFLTTSSVGSPRSPGSAVSD